MRKILYVDQDDVLADFTKSYNHQLYINPDIRWPQSQYGFFSNLEPIEGAIDGVNKLRQKYDVYILTRPSYLNPLCYVEKRIWVEKYFGLSFCENLILCGHKHLMIGDYLIDDMPWPKFTGEQLLFGRQDYPNWDSVLNRLM